MHTDPDRRDCATLRQYRVAILIATAVLWVFMGGLNRDWWGSDSALFAFFLVGGIPAVVCSPFGTLAEMLGAGPYVAQLVYACFLTGAALVYYGVVFRPLRHKLWSRPEDRSHIILRQSCYLLLHFCSSGLLGYCVLFWW